MTTHAVAKTDDEGNMLMVREATRGAVRRGLTGGEPLRSRGSTEHLVGERQKRL